VSSSDARLVESSQSGDANRAGDSLTGILVLTAVLRDHNRILETVSNGTSDYDTESHARRC
jgi:hypothetical protein